MSTGLPLGWATARLSRLCDIPREKGCEGVVPYLEIGNVDTASKGYVLTDKPSVKGCRLARKNDVLVSKVRPTRGAITWIQEDVLEISSAFTVLRNKGALAEKCLWQFLAWNREYLNHLGENCTGTMYPTTSDDAVADFEMPLAPLNEQRRIVAKLNTLLGKVDASQQRLANISVLLKRFRQSVLAAACSGRLTADWREQNRAAGKKTPAPNSIQSKYDLYSDMTLEELPEEWNWVPIGNLSSFQQGMQIAKNSRHKEAAAGRLPILRTVNYATGFSENVDYVEVNEDTLIAESEDIILSRTGTIGKVLTGVRGVFHNNSFRLNFDQSLIHRRFLIAWLEGPLVQNLIKAVSGRSAQPDLAHSAFGPFPFPLAPLTEQQEIVRRVEALFALADQIEARFQKAKAQIDKLTPSLIALAFAGKLVPQDPTDEPAAKLLERLSAGRVA